MRYHSKKTGTDGLVSFFKNRRVRCLTGIPVILLLLVLAFPGCRKDFKFDKIKDVSWNPDLAIPLVHDSITLKKALTQTGTEDHFYIDESGDISILYYFNNNAFRIRPNDLIKLAPASFPFLHRVTKEEEIILTNSDVIIAPAQFTIDLSGINPGIRVDSLSVKEGKIYFHSNNTFSNAGNLTISLLNATKNGAPFSFLIGPFVQGLTQTDSIDISGVKFDLSASPNTINAEVEGLLKKSNSPIAGDSIRNYFEARITKIGGFRGYLGQQTFSQMEDTVRVDVFNNAFALGEVYFVDPQASMTIVNSIGIPTEITIEQLLGRNDASGVVLDIANNLGSNSIFSVPSPLITATQAAIIKMNYTNENTNNSMSELFNVKPDNVAFKIKTVINPTGENLNFFRDTSSFYADLRVKLPLYGHFNLLTLQDTFDLVIAKPKEIEYLEFRTRMVNGLPLTARVQVYFTDDNYNKLDSLTGNDRILINEAPVDPSTHLPYPGMFGIKDTTFILGNQRMANLENVKKVLVKAVLNSTDEGQINVKLRASQVLDVKFTALAKLRKQIPGSK